MSDDFARSVLSMRVMGENEPLSIATGIAIDSCLGRLEEAKDIVPPVTKYDNLLVHVRTIYRNILGTVPTADRVRLTPLAIAEIIATELRIIETIVTEVSEGKCNVQFYHCSYNSIMSEFNNSLPRVPTTPGQKASTALEFSTYQALDQDIVAKPPIDQWDIKFPEIGGRTLLMTHFPVDLLNRYRFKSLDLLESHTGAIKPPSVWSTKLNNGLGLIEIPFDRMTIQLFGDKTHFSPMNKKVRMTVYNIAVKNKWTHATTKDYVISCIVKNRDPALESLVKELYRR